MKIQLLYFESCPGWQQTQKHLEEVLKEVSLNEDFRTLEITDSSQLPEAFYGSPTIRYQKQDSEEWKELFNMMGESVMACRTYFDEGRIVPYVPKAILKPRLQEIVKNNEKD